MIVSSAVDIFGESGCKVTKTFLFYKFFGDFFLLKGDENCDSVNFVTYILAISRIIPNFATDKNWKYER